MCRQVMSEHETIQGMEVITYSHMLRMYSPVQEHLRALSLSAHCSSFLDITCRAEALS